MHLKTTVKGGFSLKSAAYTLPDFTTQITLVFELYLEKNQGEERLLKETACKVWLLGKTSSPPSSGFMSALSLKLLAPRALYRLVSHFVKPRKW